MGLICSKLFSMKVRLIGATVLMLLLAGAEVLHAQPLISFESESVDFGDVRQGEVLEHDFLFRNDGTGTLVIEKLTAS